MKTTAYLKKYFLRDFTEKEILSGLELALSEPKEQIQERARAQELRENGIPYLSGEHISCLQAQWSHSVPGKQIGCKVYVDDTHGELVKTQCSCSTFHKSGYACEHVTSLLARYLMDQFGLHIFQDTGLEEKLSQTTGVTDPFLPGVLRKTDSGLLNLLKQQTAATQISPPSSTAEIMSVECLLQAEKGGLILELRFGGRRKYVVKNIRILLEALQKDQNYPLGKQTVTLGLHMLEPASRHLMEFLIMLYAQKRQTPYASGMFFQHRGGSYEERYLYLDGLTLDAFFELQAGVPMELNGVKTVFWPDVQPLGISMEKLAQGALFQSNGLKLLFSSGNWLYFQNKFIIGRLSAQPGSPTANLLELLSAKKELYISEHELPAVFSQLLPDLEKQSSISYNGLSPDLYRPEIPSFRLYLDLPQDDLVSCQVRCFYSRQKQEYLLYDDADAVKRNQSEENRMRQQISSFFDAYDETNKAMCLLCTEDRLYQFLLHDIPELSKLGEVFVSDSLKRLKVRPLPPVNVGIRMDGGLLHVSLHAPDMDTKELAELLSAYNRKKKFHRLRNGTFITLDPAQADAWSALSESWLQYGKKHPEDIPVPLFRALYFDEMLKDQEDIRLEGNRRYKELVLNMDFAREADYPVPDSLKNLLRPYQADGFRWIKTLKQCGFGGILADDMGLGKTLQILTFLLSEKEDGRSGDQIRTLIVTPASLVYNWQKEILTFTPALSCKIIAGTAATRKELLNSEGKNDADIWITSYDLLKRDIADYENLVFANQIIDEAQYIKNHGTQASKSVRLVNSSFRMALTGTPIENRLSELWSIFDFLMPGFLLGYQGFRETYEEAIMRGDDSDDTTNRLRTLVHPFILRRLKKDVLAELPDKIEKTVTVRLEGEQRRLYDAYAQRLRMYLAKQSPEEFRQNKLEILKELTRLRQLCCGPELFLENYHGENAKLNACMELVRQAIESGHKLLIFSQFTSVLDEVEKALKKEKIADFRIDGSVPKEKRMQMVEAFDTNNVPVFCISLKAGGTGLNLTAADIVIHFDPWWNVAAQNQATDRAHRIGQENTVTVYELIAEHTIEEQIQKLQKSKQDLAEEILSGEGISSILIDRDEILKLL